MTKEERFRMRDRVLEHLFEYCRQQEVDKADGRLVNQTTFYKYHDAKQSGKSYCRLYKGEFDIVLNLKFGTKKRQPVIQVHIWGDVKTADGMYDRLKNGDQEFPVPEIADVQSAWYDSQNPPEKSLGHVFDLNYSTDWTLYDDAARAEEINQKTYQMFKSLVEALNSVGAFDWTWAKKRKTKQNIADFVDNARLVTEEIVAQDLEEYAQDLYETGQIVLTGAPGTGKTMIARLMAEGITGEKLDGEVIAEHIGFCQFHPSFDYSDFVEGLRPVKLGESLGFERRDGIFMEFCRKAMGAPDENFVFLIDEINRGDISKIFGELFFAIEKSYRGKVGLKTRYNNLMDVDHPFKNGFYVPKNVYIIGTMNDIDRGVESMDFAIRRRFRWVEVTPSDRFSYIMEGVEPSKRAHAKAAMYSLNKEIGAIEGLGEAYAIGPSYFRALIDPNMTFPKLWDRAICPLLYEYLRGAPGKDETIRQLKTVYLDVVRSDEPDGDETPDELNVDMTADLQNENGAVVAPEATAALVGPAQPQDHTAPNESVS